MLPTIPVLGSLSSHCEIKATLAKAIGRLSAACSHCCRVGTSHHVILVLYNDHIKQFCIAVPWQQCEV